MTPFPREKSDGELSLPKTYLTRRGALMLYSAPNDAHFGEFLLTCLPNPNAVHSKINVSACAMCMFISARIDFIDEFSYA